MAATTERYGILEREDIYQRQRANVVSACRIAGVSRATLYRWIALGKIEVVRTAGGALRIYVDTLIVPDRRYS